VARSGKNIDFSKAKQGKSRQKTRGRASGTAIVLGGRTAHGVSLGRAGNPAGNPRALYDEYGIPRDSKYAGLGPRCRGDVAIALREGFEYQGTSATTEEQVCYGELRRRGFTLGLGTSERSFQPQSPIAGSVVDFEVWDRGERVALRPQNRYWHGHLDKINHDEGKADLLEEAGYTVRDIWSEDSLDDQGLVLKFNQFFGEE